MARTNGTSKIGLILCILFLFQSCHQEVPSKPFSKIINTQKLKSGMLVCRLGNGFFSNYFRKYASAEQKFSHIGILSIENDSVFVYHSEASELTGIGSVRRDEIHVFLKGIKVFEFYEMDYSETEIASIVSEAKKYFRQKTPFDLDFDNSNDDKLYCTELIATAINNILGEDEIQPGIILNDKEIYGLDDIYLHPRVQKMTLTN